MSIDAETLRQMIAEDDLGLLRLPVRAGPLTSDERLAASFTEITEFVREHDREPAEAATDVAEIKLFHRLAALRADDTKREALASVDDLGLLHEPEPPASLEAAIAGDDLGLLDAPEEDVFTLRNVPKPSTQPDQVAQRKPSEDFELFEPLFKQCQAELQAGTRKLVAFRNEQEIKVDTFYVLRGMLVYVAAEGERRRERGRVNARLRCIFENGTEADLLLRSLGSQLYRFGKAISDPEANTGEEIEERLGQQRGHVYVLRSLSSDARVREIPDLHKIGYTARPPEERISGASTQTTFIGAGVELVASYEMPRVMARSVEGLLHRFFAASRIDAWFERDGAPVAEVKEWFSLPLDVIEEAIRLIEAESISNFVWDPASRSIRLASALDQAVSSPNSSERTRR